MALGGAGIWGAFNFHVVKTDSGLQLVPKHTVSLSDTYVDIRQFGLAEWAAHPALSADMVAAEKSKIAGGGNSANSAAESVERAVDNVESGAREIVDQIRK
jgi:hypothetical protein